MTSIFTRIINDEIPGIFVWRDSRAVGLMDINPLAPGHVLVVPVDAVDHWLDLDVDVARHLTYVAQAIGRAQQEALNPARVGLMIAGFEVPHTHLHLVPMESMANLDFANRDPSPEPGSLAQNAEAIRDELRAMGYDEVAS